MNPLDVLAKILGLRELFAAVLAGVWFFPAVHPGMPTQLAHFAEVLIALFTLIGFLSRVGALVSYEMRATTEGFAA